MAALYFGGKHKLACAFLQEQGYIPQMLSKSQFSRRLGCPRAQLDYLFVTLFRVLGETFKELNEESVYIIDFLGNRQKTPSSTVHPTYSAHPPLRCHLYKHHLILRIATASL